MELLKERILKEGYCLSGNILKVDSFINHQIDPEFTVEMGKEFVAANLEYTKHRDAVVLERMSTYR